MGKIRSIVEFGDFQTPLDLARLACAIAARRIDPSSILEPTCGSGAFLIAALETFPDAVMALGVEINPDHVANARSALSKRGLDRRGGVIQADFFTADWAGLLAGLPDPLLVVGNPPWVTNSALGILGSGNLPEKTNFQRRTGLDARTGKSNFDISEWMLVRLLEQLRGRRATLAMLCKTAVARKVLAYGWERDFPIGRAEVHGIDAAGHFQAAVGACLFVCELGPGAAGHQSDVFAKLGDERPVATLGYRDGALVADVRSYERLRHLRGASHFRWRSGVKHDCGRVMELRSVGDRYRNGFGEVVDLEDRYVYPLLKGSEFTNGTTRRPDRRMIVTQRSVGDDTEVIGSLAPRTWAYLRRYDDALARRASSIYRGRPKYSVFGVGPYTFAPWKVAVSGFARKVRFAKVGPTDGKPTVLDDTAYFLACDTEREADVLSTILNSDRAAEFYSAFLFWDAKRPITVEVLSRLDIAALAVDVGLEAAIRPYAEAAASMAVMTRPRRRP